MAELLPVSVRTYAREIRAAGQQGKACGSHHGDEEETRSDWRCRYLLVFDCETDTDLGQALQFGCYRFFGVTWSDDGPDLFCLEEGIFHADDLADREPGAHATLADYVQANLADAVTEPFDYIDPRPDLRLRSRADFVEQVFFRALVDGAAVALFNAPFDLSRISVDWGEARAHGFEDGFSLTLFEAGSGSKEKAYRPRALVRPIDSKRSKLALSPAVPGHKPGMAAHGRPMLLDLRTLAYALTGKPQSSPLRY